jgi:predicted RNA methylase
VTIPHNILIILATMTIKGNTTVINGQLSRQDYVTTNEVLETLGGVWNRKQKCHVWTTNPAAALKPYLSAGNKQIVTTLETKKEKTKEYQQYFTPEKLAKELVAIAFGGTDFKGWQPKHILEPSAGQGSIVKAITEWFPQTTIDCYELLAENVEVLLKLRNVNYIGADFLQCDTSKKYDCIIANPPFSKHQDIHHIKRMYECLSDNGRLVTLSSNHWRHATHKIDIQFREWLNDIGADINDIEGGEFKESGTMVSANFIVINK